MSPTQALSVDVLSGDDAFEQLKSDWQRLEALDASCTPFNTWDWNALWWTRYGEGSRALLMRVSEGDRVIGIAPFHCRAERELRVFRRRVLRFVGSGGDTSPDYLGILAVSAHREAVIEAVLSRVLALGDWHTLRLDDMAAGSDLDRALAARLGTLAGHAAPVRRTLVLRAALPDRWETFVAGLSRKRRKQINHRRNRLEQAGRACLQRVSEEAERERAIDALIALHRGRWASKGQPGGFRSEAYEGFHRDVIRTFSARQALWLVTLTMDGAIIGVLYAFAWRGELMLFQSGLSPEHERLSPGHVLFGWVIREAIEHGFHALNMLKGDYHYKTAWARERTWTHSRSYYKPGIAAAGAVWRERLRRLPGVASSKGDPDDEPVVDSGAQA